jgi:hypothetical protein
MQSRRVWVLVLCLWWVGRAARADERPGSPSEHERRAKMHYEIGRAHFNMGEYDLAIREFETGYAEKPLPLFLYNMAQVALVAQRKPQALEYFERYLDAETPGASSAQRAEAAKRIAELKREHVVVPSHAAAQNNSAPDDAATPAPNAASPNNSPSNAAAQNNSPRDAAAQNNAAAQDNALVAAPPQKPSRRKLWIALGVVGGVVVAGAVAAGVAVSVGGSSPAPSGFHYWGSVDASGAR